MISFFIPGHVPSPNKILSMTLRERLRVKRSMRERAFYAGLTVIRKQRVEPFRERVIVDLCVFRKRLLDPSVNLPASLKWIQDGLSTCGHMPQHERYTCPDVLLPMGDGPKSPYVWGFGQVISADEGVRVSITRSVPERIS